MIKHNPLLQSYLTISTPDLKNNVIRLVLANKKYIKIPFDFKNCPVPVKVKLRGDVYITNDECLLYSQLMDELHLPHDLVLSMVVQYVLNDEAVVHPKTNIISLNYYKTHSIYSHEFVMIPGHYNIFFVIHYDFTKSSLLCVEVDPTGSIAYGMRYICLKQVLPTKWNEQQNNNKHMYDFI